MSDTAVPSANSGPRSAKVIPVARSAAPKREYRSAQREGFE
jgi:hypothetical protein